jgi:hypothetical protein
MANLATRLLRRGDADGERADWPTLPGGIDPYLQLTQSFGYNGLDYNILPSANAVTTTQSTNRIEEIGADFAGYAGAYRGNAVVYGLIKTRLLVFTEARFQFRQRRSGRPGDLFGTPALTPLEEPWPGATTGDLLARMLLDVDLTGNAYVARRGQFLRPMRPDWVTIVLGVTNGRARLPRDVSDLDYDVLGYAYHPGGVNSGEPPVILLPESVAHFCPEPDPLARFRGMSWLTPVVREIMADSAATQHKLTFFENAATPNMVIIGRNLKRDQAQAIQQAIWERHGGIANAYDNLVLGGVDDVKVVGSDMRQIDFKTTQGHGETRIASAAGVPPIIVGLSEGLESATYSNYTQAVRRFADATMRPLWRNAAGSLARIVDVPVGSELWYDDRDIPFLKEDVTAFAQVQSQQAGTMRTLIDGGFEADAVVDAVVSGDFARLKGKHTGLTPVQLQKPGAGDPNPETPPPANGGGDSPPDGGANGGANGGTNGGPARGAVLLEEFIRAHR